MSCCYPVGLPVIADEFETSDWKLDQVRRFMTDILGLPIEHFVMAFRLRDGQSVGVVASSPNAIQELDPKAIHEKAAKAMLEEGRRIIRKEVDIAPIIRGAYE